ncbi:MAG: polyprenyl synthetase family protein [Planctomycetes bacterium]|nr:polyprenyl synthetase family protein [Planctomycetota bacterium]
MTERTAEAAGLFEPIRAEIARVEALIRREAANPNPFVQTLVEHQTKHQGKRARPALLLYSAHICGGEPQELHYGLAAVIEMLHTATLAHDDVLDEAEIRRNVPTLNRMWGNEASVLFGDYLFAKAYALCARLHNREANLIFATAVQDICVGELSQIAGRFNFDLEEDQYLNLIRLKTAVLFSTACRLGAVGTEAEPRIAEALAEYGEKVGIAFQIVDDCLDITGDERVMGKSLGTDLAKGKLTLPVIRLLKELSPGERRGLQQVMSSANGKDPRAEVLRLLHERDVLAWSLGRAQEFAEEAKAALREVPPSAHTESLANLADFVVSRRS